ncbi:hypothetical protein C1632_09080 [Microbacterium testaceum]|uniref:hypothetical protein n=1 Tax=Microbacterium testaceum TaxID=2033 RepID=UPI000CCED1BA|nr:hypothetical protein [Microbacterium testaceum]PNW09219.1 hypothetical protein C1632_09080 [Microbacterium testaceum]
MDDDVELRRLRERVYGAEGASATPAMIERLAELEDQARRSDRPMPVLAAPAPPPAAVAPVPTIGEQPPPETPRLPDATRLTPRRALRIVAAVVGALALLGIGIAIGASTAPTMAATPDPAAAAYPELTFPQTVEDVISAEILRDSGIDAASTRYIATVSDFRIYLAQPDDGDGRCIVTFTSTDNRPWSAGCASGAQDGAAIFGIDDTLTVAIGDPDDSDVTGIPIRLSPSVTAYVAQ